MDEKNICKLYEKGESIRKISKNSNYSYEKILEILIDNAYNCRWKGTDKCSQIFHYLYDDATIYLTRKYDIAKAYL